MNILEEFEKSKMGKKMPDFKPGDTIEVHQKIREGEKERIQIFQGVVIARKSGTTNATFTVRKRSFGVGVEKIYPLYSPLIEKIKVVRKGKVRRAKLYYLRDRKGKAARLKEKRDI